MMSATAPRFSQDKIKEILAVNKPTTLQADRSLISAAVLVPLLAAPNDFRVLFTVRTSRVETHKGQVSFPGGARDPEDPSLEATAVRETQEEVGIKTQDIAILGRLDDLPTRTSDFVITPYVGVVPYPYTYTPSEIEVAEILEVPLSYLWGIAQREPGWSTMRQERVREYEYPYGNHVIWGATARILTGFLHLLTP